MTSGNPTSRRRAARAALALAVVILGGAAAAAQRGFFSRADEWDIPSRSIPYDGRFTFVRVKYRTAPGGYWAGGRPAWSHGDRFRGRIRPGPYVRARAVTLPGARSAGGVPLGCGAMTEGNE